ncbi:predicted protein [Lichtheimia corymbifera JMRC:FSU:9682]|uniref:Uncharacterized protein n=1 Tax=Lichtheimia corymbifera JMRC:FSU:9682 TaxID=1263082 RepID=A0A068RYA0_9FUNG|nr:predicted protein [Lichtheimia corymbifera JMRC:FSU:9682]
MSRAALSMMCTDLIDADPAQSENMDSLITRTMAIVEVHLHSSNCGVVVVHKLGTLRETTKSPFFFALTSQSKRQLGDQVVNGDTFQLQTFNDQYACNLSMTQTSIPIQHIDVLSLIQHLTGRGVYSFPRCPQQEVFTLPLLD